MIDVSYGTEVESAISELLNELRRDARISVTGLRRFVANQLLEDDEALSDFVLSITPEGEELLRKAEEIGSWFEKETGRNLGDERGEWEVRLCPREHFRRHTKLITQDY